MNNQSVLAVSVVLASMTTNVAANGFFVPQQSVQGIGRAQAGGAAIANDLSTVFFNPAGLTRLWRDPNVDERYKVLGSLHVIIPRIQLADLGTTATAPGTGGQPVPVGGGDGGNPGRTTPVPNLYFGTPLSGDFFLGVGLTAPFGLSAEYDDGWFGRYDSIESSLLTLNLAPSLAVKLGEKLSVGGGIDIQYADAELTNAIPNPLVPGGPTADTDGLFALHGDDTSVGFNLGLLLEATRSTRVGLHYRSAMNHQLTGIATTSGLSGPLAAANGEVSASTDVNLPPIASLGVAHETNDRWTLLGEVMWFGWSSFDEIRVQLDDGNPDAVRKTSYRDSYTVAGGAEYRVSDGLTLRGGAQYDRTPTRDGFRDTSFPDGDRIWYSFGVSYHQSRRLALDLSVTHVPFKDGPIELNRIFFEGSPITSDVRVDALAKTTVSTIAASLRLTF